MQPEVWSFHRHCSFHLKATVRTLDWFRNEMSFYQKKRKGACFLGQSLAIVADCGSSNGTQVEGRSVLPPPFCFPGISTPGGGERTSGLFFSQKPFIEHTMTLEEEKEGNRFSYDYLLLLVTASKSLRRGGRVLDIQMPGVLEIRGAGVTEEK